MKYMIAREFSANLVMIVVICTNYAALIIRPLYFEFWEFVDLLNLLAG